MSFVGNRLVAAGAVGLSLLVAGNVAARADEFINVLTGGTSGVYYPLGVALSRLFETAVPDSKTSVQATKASVENLNLLQAGRGELAFTLGDALTDAWKGNEDAGYKQPLNKLRVLAGIYPNYIQVFALEGSGIKTLADLKGKRVSVGAPKSGTELNARSVFKAAGLSVNSDYDQIAKVEYLGYEQSVQLMKNNQLDATLQSSGLGAAAFRDLAVSRKIVVVPIPADVVAKIGNDAYQPGVIPANTYDGQTTDVPTAIIQNFLVTRAGLSDDTVYKMTKALWENLPTLTAAHSAAKAITPEHAVAKVPVPYHPGAIKYYKEVGLMK
jgi:uncharacterized protein